VQTFATHRRLDPAYHYLLSSMLAVNLGAAVVHLIRHHRGAGDLTGSLWMLMTALALALMGLKLRSYPLRVQDRLIRLEERLRMEQLLPEDLKARLGELRPAQFVALRFASDGEVADRVREALEEGLGGEAIKKRIQSWRPDEFRV
jgi:hypothetical protein